MRQIRPSSRFGDTTGGFKTFGAVCTFSVIWVMCDVSGRCLVAESILFLLFSQPADGDAVHTHSQLAVEYLQGMFHSGSPTALLPKFPSWNLCCMDDARSFNHQIGKDDVLCVV